VLRENGRTVRVPLGAQYPYYPAAAGPIAAAEPEGAAMPACASTVRAVNGAHDGDPAAIVFAAMAPPATALKRPLPLR
jgi:hypothetical protein